MRNIMKKLSKRVLFKETFTIIRNLIYLTKLFYFPSRYRFVKLNLRYLTAMPITYNLVKYCGP